MEHAALHGQHCSKSTSWDTGQLRSQHPQAGEGELLPVFAWGALGSAPWFPWAVPGSSSLAGQLLSVPGLGMAPGCPAAQAVLQTSAQQLRSPPAPSTCCLLATAASLTPLISAAPRLSRPALWIKSTRAVGCSCDASYSDGLFPARPGNREVIHCSRAARYVLLS